MIGRLLVARICEGLSWIGVNLGESRNRSASNPINDAYALANPLWSDLPRNAVHAHEAAGTKQSKRQKRAQQRQQSQQWREAIHQWRPWDFNWPEH